MATAREIRRRIRSVKNIAQITRAQQLVASSRMRRAQERVLASRPYAEQLRRMLSRLSNQGGEHARPLMEKHSAVRKILIVVMTPDRGLAGALSANVNRRAGQLSLDLRRDYPDARISFVAVGRKARDFIVRSGQSLLAEFTGLGDVPKLSDVRAIARVLTDAYLGGEADHVVMVYPKYISIVTQTPTVIQMLPIEPPATTAEAGVAKEYIFEPNTDAIFDQLVPRYLETLIHQPLLETVASFYSAQMLAMKNATDNATELVDDLTLTYNKARQSAITTQILEVVSGAGELG
jgi:F-type H+-transporting ATPase subunit gamma